MSRPGPMHNQAALLSLWGEAKRLGDLSDAREEEALADLDSAQRNRRESAAFAVLQGRELVKLRAELSGKQFLDECRERLDMSPRTADGRVLMGKYIPVGNSQASGEVCEFPTIAAALSFAESERDRIVAEEKTEEAERLRQEGKNKEAEEAQAKADTANRRSARKAKEAAEKKKAADLQEAAKAAEAAAEKEAASKQREEDKAAARAAPSTTPPLSADAPIHHCAVAELHQHFAPASVDTIFTDPPYPAEFLPCFPDLAAFALHALKPGGLLLCMTGQQALPDKLAALAVAGLDYRWTLALAWPHIRQDVHPAKVECHWKPVAVFTRTGGAAPTGYNPDYFHTGAVERDAKDKHVWGQPIAVNVALLSKWMPSPGLVVDPFCGAGALLAAARECGHAVAGADIDEAHVATARQRLAAPVKEEEREAA